MVLAGKYRMQKLWPELVRDVICALTLFFLNLREEITVVVNEEFVPKQETDHTPPLDVRAPFAGVLRALLRKGLKCWKINVGVAQFPEQHLNLRWASRKKALEWNRKATLLLSPNNYWRQ